MAQKNRSYLDGKWVTNYKPTQTDYRDIFDSFYNITDDTNISKSSFGITADGGGAVITTGSLGFTVIPYAGTITKWYLVGDRTGSIVFDLKRGGTSIIGGGNSPTLSSAQRANASVSGWTSVAIAANDEIEFIVSSASTVQRVNLIIEITKS